MLTIERLLELMDFDAEAGSFTWKGKPHFGAYDTPEEAHEVYMAKRRELFQEFA